LSAVARRQRGRSRRTLSSPNIPRLCFLDFMLDPGTSRSRRFDEFFQGLSDLGYVDGRTIAIGYLSADGHGERFSALIAECVRRNVDIIAVSTTPAAQVAKNATHTIPIVMIGFGDPVGTGLVDSLARAATSMSAGRLRTCPRRSGCLFFSTTRSARKKRLRRRLLPLEA
jgi:ABC transporter substrate binding protein